MYIYFYYRVSKEILENAGTRRIWCRSFTLFYIVLKSNIFMLPFFEYTLENIRVLFWQFKFEKRMFPGYCYGGANFDFSLEALHISILDRIFLSECHQWLWCWVLLLTVRQQFLLSSIFKFFSNKWQLSQVKSQRTSVHECFRSMLLYFSIAIYVKMGTYVKKNSNLEKRFLNVDCVLVLNMKNRCVLLVSPEVQ